MPLVPGGEVVRRGPLRVSKYGWRRETLARSTARSVASAAAAGARGSGVLLLFAISVFAVAIWARVKTAAEIQRLLGVR